MPSKAPSFVRFAGESTAEVRTAMYGGQEVLAVPIVALVGGVVVKGLLSDGPEYVPPDVLAAAPGGWSGRPVLAYHPDDTANTPETWDTTVFGQVFYAEFSDNRLRCEIYLNPRLAERAGEDAVEVVNKARNGERFDVSVGAWIWLEDEEGVSPNGEKYSQRWQAVVPDHVAAGLARHGGKGACSNEMGCGGPRVFAGPRVYTAEQAETIKENTMSQPLVARLATKLGKTGIESLAEGMSNNELHQKLNRALRAVVPAFWGVEDIFMESSTAIYVAMPGDSLEFWECAFTVDDKGEVALGRRKQVEPVTEWKKVAKSGEPNDEPEVKKSANCKCHEAPNGDPAAGGNEPPNKGKGDKMSQKSQEPTAAAVELAGRLIANSAAPFKDTPPAVLAALGETQLQGIIDKYAETPAPTPPSTPSTPSTPSAPTPTPPANPGGGTSAAGEVTISADKLAQLERLAAREEARDKVRRADLVKALLATGRKGFDEKALNAKSTDELESLAQFVEAEIAEPTFAGPGNFAMSREIDNDVYVPVDPWGTKDKALLAALGTREAGTRAAS